jgi:lipoprotein-anchoring transpeptidase ErfK/SrfK
MTMLSLRPIAQSTTGDLLEVDKGRQLIFFVRNGKPILTVNTSTGSDIPYTEVDQKNGGTVTGDAHTPEGRFHVYREVPDGWEHGQLGDLYRPRYFNGGVALHGAPNIPNYPASHGCVRVSTAFMDYVWATDLLPHGSEVWVHS